MLDERKMSVLRAIVEDYVRATYGGEPRTPALDPERRTIPLKTTA